MYNSANRPYIASFVRPGGRDIYPEQFKYMIQRAQSSKEKNAPEYEMIGVRE